jgi:hypothetical protein
VAWSAISLGDGGRQLARISIIADAEQGKNKKVIYVNERNRYRNLKTILATCVVIPKRLRFSHVASLSRVVFIRVLSRSRSRNAVGRSVLLETDSVVAPARRVAHPSPSHAPAQDGTR